MKMLLKQLVLKIKIFLIENQITTKKYENIYIKITIINYITTM